MALALIIFDCDGVILESVDCKSRAYERIGQEYGLKAGDALLQYHLAHGGVNRVQKFHWFFENVLGREITPEEMESLKQKFVDYALDEIRASGPVPGVLDVLKRWKGRVPMYVASGAPHEELVDILEQKELSHYFAGIYGAPPGKTELLRIILREAGLPASDTLMIGDSNTDLYAAEAVGANFYGRGEGFKHTLWPWHHDLTRLNEYLEEMHQAP